MQSLPNWSISPVGSSMICVHAAAHPHDLAAERQPSRGRSADPGWRRSVVSVASTSSTRLHPHPFTDAAGRAARLRRRRAGPSARAALERCAGCHTTARPMTRANLPIGTLPRSARGRTGRGSCSPAGSMPAKARSPGTDTGRRRRRRVAGCWPRCVRAGPATGSVVVGAGCLAVPAATRAQPRLLPDEAALCLAATVGSTIATVVVEEDSVGKPAALQGRVDGVAHLLGPTINGEPPPAWAIISGMNGMASSAPRSSSVSRISAAPRTSTRSPCEGLRLSSDSLLERRPPRERRRLSVCRSGLAPLWGSRPAAAAERELTSTHIMGVGSAWPRSTGRHGPGSRHRRAAHGWSRHGDACSSPGSRCVAVRGGPTTGPAAPRRPATCRRPTPPDGRTGAAATLAFPVAVSSNGRYLVDQRGHPSCSSATRPSASRPTVDRGHGLLLRRSAGPGLQHRLGEPDLRDVHPRRHDASTYDGIKPFLNDDLSTPNPDYFARMDTMVAARRPPRHHAAARSGGDRELPRSAQGQRRRQEPWLREFLGARYKDAQNIIWMLGNDYQTDQWNPYDPYELALVARHPQLRPRASCRRSSSIPPVSTSFDDSAWPPLIDVATAYSYSPDLRRRASAYDSHPTQPVIMVEANYEDENNDGGPRRPT